MSLAGSGPASFLQLTMIVKYSRKEVLKLINLMDKNWSVRYNFTLFLYCKKLNFNNAY
ncbi:MAG: Uncharacterised protein [Flavobacteriaceae bacterium]|nr:MAG: Uncharacterised protein [Flavobacteriaceae bacterium]